MKLKKLLALALAGVLMLTLLTGCSGSGTGEDRLAAKAVADILKPVYPNAEVSYGVPALPRTIRPAFTPEWFLRDWEGNIYALDRDFLTDSGQRLGSFLKDSLKAYEQNSSVYFFAFESTGMSAREQAERFNGGVPSLNVYYKDMSPSATTKLRVGVCHKTVEDREYCLVVVVLS